MLILQNYLSKIIIIIGDLKKIQYFVKLYMFASNIGNNFEESDKV